MKILAVDPGTDASAYVIWDGTRILDKQFLSNSVLLEWLSNQDNFTMENPHRPNLFAIEMIASYGMAVGREVFETCLWIGKFSRQIEITFGESPTLIYRRQVKACLCHSPDAKDANIRQAIIDRLGKPGTKKAPGVTYGISKHLWAALGVALTCEAQDQSVNGDSPPHGQRT